MKAAFNYNYVDSFHYRNCCSGYEMYIDNNFLSIKSPSRRFLYGRFNQNHIMELRSGMFIILLEEKGKIFNRT